MSARLVSLQAGWAPLFALHLCNLLAELTELMLSASMKMQCAGLCATVSLEAYRLRVLRLSYERLALRFKVRCSIKSCGISVIDAREFDLVRWAGDAHELRAIE